MAAKIQKWGNSLGVRIPKHVAEKAHLSENTEVEIETKNGTIVIFPRQSRYSLKKLTDGITDENLHREDAIEPVGREIW